MDTQDYKEVYFDEYCKKCENWKENDEGLHEPCDGCLENPINLHSHKPVNFKQRGK